MDTPTYRNPGDLKSPIFTPRPGWGSRFKTWSKQNGMKLFAIIAVLAVGTAIAVDQIRDDNDGEEVVKASPSPTPKNGSVSGTNTQRYEFRTAPGQGITHLARAAVSGYLKDTPSTTLIPEQRVFAEDFLKDRTLMDRIGSKLLEINETLIFEATDVRAAVNAALSLTAEQIAALTRFVRLIVGF